MWAEYKSKAERLRMKLAFLLCPSLKKDLVVMADTIYDLSLVMKNSDGVVNIYGEKVITWETLMDPDHFFGWVPDMENAKTAAANVRYYLKPWVS